MSRKVAVVTGSNKGIGYGIVKALCQRGVSDVYLTARDVNKGVQAVEALKKENLNPKFYQLDVTDSESVKNFGEFLRSKHDGIDILINNAGVFCKYFNDTTYEDSKYVIDVNYRSYFNIQNYLYTVLNDNARVINISSSAGHISNIKNKYWIKRLVDENLEVQTIDEFVDWFLLSVKNNTLKNEDFTFPAIHAYTISKIALCALTRVMQKNIGRGISINSLHPGFVKTDMTRSCGVFTSEEASNAPVYLALDCDQSLKGKYIWFDKSEKDWTDTHFKYDEDTEEFRKMTNSFEK